jgi:hypothetical protein
LRQKKTLNLLPLSGWHYSLPARNSRVLIVLGHAVAEVVTDYYLAVLAAPLKTEVRLDL